ncbi:MAG: peroxiredoxin [Gemmataceae bacterium]
MISCVSRLSAFAVVLALLAAGRPALADDKKPLENKKPAEDKKPADDKKTELTVGDAAPAFAATDDQGKTWKSADHYGKKFVVVYFYPGDFTPGCTAQASAFRDAMNQLAAQGVEVVGVSGDSAATHEQFKTVQKLNFALLADEKGELAKQFGVPFGKGAKVKVKATGGKPLEIDRAGTAARWTFIVGKDGKIAYKNTKVTPAADAKQILEFVSAAEGKKQ